MSEHVTVKADGPRNRQYRVVWSCLKDGDDWQEVAACKREGDAQLLAKLWNEHAERMRKLEVHS